MWLFDVEFCVGWQIASTWYITRIKAAISRIRDALPSILPLNRVDFDWYFTIHWSPIFSAIAGFNQWKDATLQDRFQEYINSEEDRIRGNLEKIKYEIDTVETVSLVVGSSRLEKVVRLTFLFSARRSQLMHPQGFFPLLCLLLERDLRRVKLATRIVIAREELTNMQTTMWYVFRALDRRYAQLCGKTGCDVAVCHKLMRSFRPVCATRC